MLTGDNKSIGSKVAKELGLDKVYAELLPADKVEKLEELFSQKSKKGTDNWRYNQGVFFNLKTINENWLGFTLN